MDIIITMITTSTTKNIIDNITISLTYPMNNITEEAEHKNKSLDRITIILVSVFGGLLGLCIMTIP